MREAATFPVLGQPLPLTKAEIERFEDHRSPIWRDQRPGGFPSTLKPFGGPIQAQESTKRRGDPERPGVSLRESKDDVWLDR
jgi:hypothetical protein